MTRPLFSTLLALSLTLAGCFSTGQTESDSDPIAVTVVVTDGAGVPLVGTVRISWMEQDSRSWTDGETVVCDAQGRAEMLTRRFRHGKRCQVRVHVDAAGYSSADQEWGGCRGGDELRWDCVLAPGAPMLGFLPGPTGPVVVPLG